MMDRGVNQSFRPDQSDRRARVLVGLLRAAASLRLAVALLVLLAAVLAWATVLEARNGREFTAWHVYSSSWFVSLWALLGANVLAALLVRLPWPRRQFGFVLAHVGVLILLAGAAQTQIGGIEGRIELREGEQADRCVSSARSMLRIVRDVGGQRQTTDRPFTPGPADWPAGRCQDLGNADGVGVRILRFYRHAQPLTEWVADERDFDGPALRLRVIGPSGNALAEDWLAANTYGGEAIVGPTRYELWPLPLASLTEDFLRPPPDLGRAGVLSIHHAGRMTRISVDENLQRRIALDEHGLAVEIATYLPDAKPTPKGGFVSVSSRPRNPLLELKVYLPGRPQPLRQVAFALRPLLNLDAVQGEVCPVRFWYHHAGLKPVPGVVFAQTPDGRLLCRAERDAAYGPPREVRQGDQIELGGQFQVAVERYLPRARQDVSFQPIEASADQTDAPEAAVQVEVNIAGSVRIVWLQRADPRYSAQTILANRESVFLSLGYESHPLGYALELAQIVRRADSGRGADAAYSSVVRLRDAASGLDERREISPNRPLTDRGFTVYQSAVQEPAHGRKVSLLTAACDPGRGLKYAGSALICAGLVIIVCRRGRAGRTADGSAAGQDTSGKLNASDAPVAPGGLDEPSGSVTASLVVRPRAARAGRSSGLLLLGATLALGITPTKAWCSGERAFDWAGWRALPAQDEGRIKPLDSLARETFHVLSGAAQFTDPQTGQRLDASTLYLAMLFDWQGWDSPADWPTHESGRAPSGYFSRFRPDTWDQAPLLRIDSPVLAQALGLPTGQNRVSPLALSQAKISFPDTASSRPFVNWAEGLVQRDEQALTPIETAALELAAKLWAYQAHRTGARLTLLPIQGDDDQRWISLADLVQADWNEQSDPTGLVRQARTQFLAARSAYLIGAAGDFNRASAQFLRAVQQLGPQLGPYPKPSLTRLEVMYNRLAPFRWAAAAMLLALLGVVLNRGTNLRLFRMTAFAAYAIGIIAMLLGFSVRVAVSGRAPVANMYESVIYVALGIAGLGLVIGARRRQQFALATAAALAALALILADHCPTVLDAALRPLSPVLRSNFWLIAHVLIITLGYAALALALGLGNVSLTAYLLGREESEATQRRTELTYRALQLGVLFLAAGTILGALWADHAWGRFWGWDPKESWALASLLAYLAVLHARAAGWTRDFGLAALAVLCFSLIVMAWYGVNYVLGAGLHSYGFGRGGAAYVVAAIILQTLYVAAAATRYVASGAAAEVERAARLERAHDLS